MKPIVCCYASEAHPITELLGAELAERARDGKIEASVFRHGRGAGVTPRAFQREHSTLLAPLVVVGVGREGCAELAGHLGASNGSIVEEGKPLVVVLIDPVAPWAEREKALCADCVASKNEFGCGRECDALFQLSCGEFIGTSLGPLEPVELFAAQMRVGRASAHLSETPSQDTGAPSIVEERYTFGLVRPPHRLVITTHPGRVPCWACEGRGVWKVRAGTGETFERCVSCAGSCGNMLGSHAVAEEILGRTIHLPADSTHEVYEAAPGIHVASFASEKAHRKFAARRAMDLVEKALGELETAGF